MCEIPVMFPVVGKSYFRIENTIENNHCLNYNRCYLFYTWSDKAIKGSDVNRTLSYLPGGSLIISLRIDHNLCSSLHSHDFFFFSGVSEIDNHVWWPGSWDRECVGWDEGALHGVEVYVGGEGRGETFSLKPEN